MFLLCDCPINSWLLYVLRQCFGFGEFTDFFFVSCVDGRGLGFVLSYVFVSHVLSALVIISLKAK